MILQLEILSGVARGLTHTSEGLLEGEVEPAELEKINVARQDGRMVKLRGDVFGVVRSVVEIWSTDVGVGLVSLGIAVCNRNLTKSLIYDKIGPQRLIQINNVSSNRYNGNISSRWSTS